jgi:excisionase family DNA binding protein
MDNTERAGPRDGAKYQEHDQATVHGTVDAGDPGTLLTVAEVAAMLRVSKMTIYRLIDSGDLVAIRVSRSWRVPEAAARAFYT